MPRKKAITPQKQLFLQSSESEDGKGSKEAGAASSPKSVSPSCFFLLTNSCAKQQPAAATTETLPMLHNQWRGWQQSAATKISRQLRTKWTLDAIVDDHLGKLRSHYTRTMLPSHPRDLPRLLFPSWEPPFLTAALSWHGGTWRPSSVLSLVVPSLSSPLSSPKKHCLLQESIRRLRIQEAVLDEEMMEYQSMSVLNLLRRDGANNNSNYRKIIRNNSMSSKMEMVWKEMRKVESVVVRAQTICGTRPSSRPSEGESSTAFRPQSSSSRSPESRTPSAGRLPGGGPGQGTFLSRSRPLINEWSY